MAPAGADCFLAVSATFRRKASQRVAFIGQGIGVPVRQARMLVLRPQYGLPGHSGTHLTLVPPIVNDCLSAGIGRNV